MTLRCSHHFLLAATHHWWWLVSGSGIVIVLGGRSPQLCFTEINHMVLQILAWMSALPGAYCKCADELCESYPLLSGPVVAPVIGELCSWCPRAPLDFWLSEQTAAGKQGVKLSAHFLIGPKEIRGGHINTWQENNVLNRFFILFFVIEEKTGVDSWNSKPLHNLKACGCVLSRLIVILVWIIFTTDLIIDLLLNVIYQKIS